LFFPNISFSEDTTSKDDSELYNPVPAIMHHISDSHEWHLLGEGDASVTIPLPVILITEGNLDVFMSSAFNHGHTDVVKGDRVYSMDSHGHIHEKNHLSILDLSITKNVASMFLALIVMLFLFIISANKSKKNSGAPSGILSFIEPLVLFVRDDIVKPNLGHNYKKFLPYLLTLFFFILVNNLLGLLPGAANVTGNIAVTLVLSFITLIVTNFSANKSYWGHIFKPPGVPLALMPIMIPIELVGVFTKPFALMIRLFANISAGHIIILSLISLIFMAQSGLGTAGAFGLSPVSVLFVLFMYFIEILVAFLQAYIFTLLTSLFIGLATTEAH
jgi:F-type H+-transporting ATPase subunit a